MSIFLKVVWAVLMLLGLHCYGRAFSDDSAPNRDILAVMGAALIMIGFTGLFGVIF